MSVKELQKVMPDGEKIGMLSRALQNGTTDPICYVERGLVPQRRNAQALLQKLLFWKGEDTAESYESYVAIDPESETYMNPTRLAVVGLEDIHEGQAHIAIDPESTIAREDPAFLHGFLQIAMEKSSVRVGLLNPVSAGLSIGVLEDAGFILHSSGDYVLQLAA